MKTWRRKKSAVGFSQQKRDVFTFLPTNFGRSLNIPRDCGAPRAGSTRAPRNPTGIHWSSLSLILAPPPTAALQNSCIPCEQCKQDGTPAYCWNRLPSPRHDVWNEPSRLLEIFCRCTMHDSLAPELLPSLHLAELHIKKKKKKKKLCYVPPSPSSLQLVTQAHFHKPPFI